MVKAKAPKENKKSTANTHSNHSNHKDKFTKANTFIVISDDEEAVPVIRKRCRLTKDNKLVNNKVFDVSSSDDEKVQKTVDNEEPLPVICKRYRLTKDGKLVNNIVVDLISSDDEKTQANKVVDLTSSDDEKAQSTVVKTPTPNHLGEKNPMISDDEEPVTFTCSKTTQDSIASNRHKYMLYDEDTDDEHENNNSVSEEGVWVNINDLDEPFYDLVDYKPKYTILDEDINEESSTGDYKYTAIDEEYDDDDGDDKYTAMDEEYDREVLRKHNMSDNEMWDDMVDIDGKVRETHVSNSYIDDEVWEVDSDAYSVRSVSSDDDIASFINDGSTDYETNEDENSDDDI